MILLFINDFKHNKNIYLWPLSAVWRYTKQYSLWYQTKIQESRRCMQQSKVITYNNLQSPCFIVSQQSKKWLLNGPTQYTYYGNHTIHTFKWCTRYKCDECVQSVNRIFIVVSLSSQTYSYSEGDAPEKQKSTEIIRRKIVAHDHIHVSVRVTHFTGIFNITRRCRYTM